MAENGVSDFLELYDRDGRRERDRHADREIDVLQNVYDRSSSEARAVFIYHRNVYIEMLHGIVDNGNGKVIVSLTADYR